MEEELRNLIVCALKWKEARSKNPIDWKELADAEDALSQAIKIG